MKKKEYKKNDRGAEWRKWDLHIHTPNTKKNDRYAGTNLKEKWGEFVKTINESEEEISVIGITDYASIENYFTFKDLVDKGEITKNFDMIVPNIELRITPVAGSGTPINIHCLFNPEIDIQVEDRFLSKLKFEYNGSSYSAKKSELIRLGRDFKCNNNLAEEAAYKEGVNQFVLDFNSLRKVFKDDPCLRYDTMIVVSNKTGDGASGIVKQHDFFENNTSQLETTRRSIYKFSDAIFSSNEGDRNYFIGLKSDTKEEIIKKFGSLKPCIHGCDAHSNEKVFNPDENRFCWIKANPTFAGLRQIMYEPETRVRIQQFKPEDKNDRYIISELQFNSSNSLFGNQKILLNDNLNSIIGGKSSGKSLLLNSISKAIDPAQEQRISKKLNFEGYDFGETFDFRVIWKNGDVDNITDVDNENKNRKITYIPQLYINYLAERNNKEELNSLINNILLQDKGFKVYFEENQKSINDLSLKIQELLSKLINLRSNGIKIREELKETGSSQAIAKSIKELELKIEEYKKASNLKQVEIDAYNKLKETHEKLSKGLINQTNKEAMVTSIARVIEETKGELFGLNVEHGAFSNRGKIYDILGEYTEVPEDIMHLVKKISSDYDILIENLQGEKRKLGIAKLRKEIEEKIRKIENDLKPYNKKLEGQKELKKKEKGLEKEKTKLEKSKNLEKKFKEINSNYSETKGKISDLLFDRINLYIKIQNEINNNKNSIGQGVNLHCKLRYAEKEFKLCNQINRTYSLDTKIFKNLFSREEIDYNLIPELFKTSIKVEDHGLFGKYADEKYRIPLRKNVDYIDVLNGLIEDNFEFDFQVTYQGDELLKMSPGKKGTVLLILFLQISSSEYPILIDQPEDNLDNRTIYDLLCTMIKEKKSYRQIIIVSHNANIVVSTDSENIIVANQNGTGDLADDKTRFEYINGALEFSFPKNDKIGSELQNQGIKEHVCDILEGGDEAFKNRERKYALDEKK